MKSKLPWIFVTAAFLLLTCVLPYAAGYGAEKKTILANIAMYWQNPTWQHGALALPVAFFILWNRRGQLFAVPMRPSDAGFAIVIFGLLTYVLGYLANIFYFGYAGVMLVAAGMAAALPVICLDLGGPGFIVDESCGWKVPVFTPGQTVKGLAAAITEFATWHEEREQRAVAARRRVLEKHTWQKQGKQLRHYMSLIVRSQRTASS